MNVELARQHWREGSARIEAARRDPGRYAQLSRQVELVTAALRHRVGAIYTLADLADAYEGADDWARALLEDARHEDAPPPDAADAADAAFHVYARGATDYVP